MGLPNPPGFPGIVFTDYYRRMHFASISAEIENASSRDVEHALSKAGTGQISDRNILALLSPAALPYLEEMARMAQSITRQRHGNIIQIYAPLYLSNECRSSCTYCGFSYENNIRRRTLSMEEIEKEGSILYDQGIRHVLLLTGEDYKRTPVQFIADAARRLAKSFSSVSIEVYPLKEDDYSMMREAGVDGLAVYQETYDPECYRRVHLRGMKKNLEFRLECPDRAASAGIRKISIGALLGLSDSATEVFFCAQHARYLMKTYWQTQLSVSLPRLRPAEGLTDVPLVKNRSYVQYLCALRIILPDAGIILSTREGESFRDQMAGICITQMSAGSRTEPGGYSGLEATVQFETEDRRSVHEFCSSLRAKGLEPVFTDWSPVMK